MMADKTTGIDVSKRRPLHNMFGIGAGLVTADLLLPQTSSGAVLGLQGKGQTAVASIDPLVRNMFDVREMGAVGDGTTVDTPAINRTIEEAARVGGGTVLFPAGTYLSYSIRLKSNVALYLERGATILAGETGPRGHYDAAEPNPEAGHYEDFGHRHWHNALLWGVGLENISILGPGLIWGKGLTSGRDQRRPGVGDKSISLKNCHNVTIRDVSILEGGHFCVLATGVDNFTADNVVLDTHRDGIDIDCCHNVRLSNMSVNSPWDDGICLKSSYALGYIRSTENLTLTNCFVTGGYHVGTLLDGTFKLLTPTERHMPSGRIKFGTESSGGFKNITISNCVFDHGRGFQFLTLDGALIEEVSVSNVTMRNICDWPVMMAIGQLMRCPAGRPIGKLRRVNMSNIVAFNTTARYCSILNGLPGHEIEDVRLSDIIILSQGGGTQEDAAIKPPEKPRPYPAHTMFGPMPAYGFYIRHVKGIQMSNIDVRTTNKDSRPAFILDDVEHADFIHVKKQRGPGSKMFKFENTRDFNVYLSRPVPETHLEKVSEKEI